VPLAVRASLVPLLQAGFHEMENGFGFFHGGSRFFFRGLRPIVRIASRDGVHGQFRRTIDELLEAIIVPPAQLDQARKRMSTFHVHILEDEEGLQRLLGTLLGVETHRIRGRVFDSYHGLRRPQIVVRLDSVQWPVSSHHP